MQLPGGAKENSVEWTRWSCVFFQSDLLCNYEWHLSDSPESAGPTDITFKMVCPAAVLGFLNVYTREAFTA